MNEYMKCDLQVYTMFIGFNDDQQTNKMANKH